MNHIRKGWMIIRDDEGHKFVECVTDNKEDLLKIWEQIKNDLLNFKANSDITAEVVEDITDDNLEGEIKWNYKGKYSGSYYYDVIEGAINIWAHDPAFNNYL